MTFKIDNDALKTAMLRHYEEKLAKDLREMFIYSASEDMNHIWQLYMEEVKQAEEDRKHHVQDFWNSFAMIIGASIALYAAYRFVDSLTPS